MAICFFFLFFECSDWFWLIALLLDKEPNNLQAKSLDVLIEKALKQGMSAFCSHSLTVIYMWLNRRLHWNGDCWRCCRSWSSSYHKLGKKIEEVIVTWTVSSFRISILLCWSMFTSCCLGTCKYIYFFEGLIDYYQVSVNLGLYYITYYLGLILPRKLSFM